MKIAYITIEDPNHKHSWSGTNYFILQALRKRFGEVDALGPVSPRITLFFLKAINFITLRLLGRRFDYRHSIRLSITYAGMIERKLKEKKYDLIVAPTGNALLAYVKTDVPIVYIADRTIRGAFNYHEQFKNLFEFSKTESFQIDTLMLNKAALNCFPSDWAARSAIQDYHIDPSRVKVIPFGANLDTIPPFNPGEKNKEDVKLLFIGVHWTDKGGDIAYETHQALKAKGIRSKLVICGCRPPSWVQDPDVIAEGFLRKDIEEENEKLLNHFKTADFLILPTRYEAYGLVFCEAAAYSLPVLATDTGGIPSIVKDGLTGFLLPQEARGDSYAQKIIGIIRDQNKMMEMRKSAYERYKQTLNWDSWLDEFESVLKEKNLVR